jgi:hypothetical protein
MTAILTIAAIAFVAAAAFLASFLSRRDRDVRRELIQSRLHRGLERTS